MREQLEASIVPSGIALTFIDIEGHDDLEARFGNRVPVLYVGDSELCFGSLDMDLLEEALANNR